MQSWFDMMVTFAEEDFLRDVIDDYFAAFPAYSAACPCDACRTIKYRVTESQAVKLLAERNLDTRADLIAAFAALGDPDPKRDLEHHSYGLLIIELGKRTGDDALVGAGRAIAETADYHRVRQAREKESAAEAKRRAKRRAQMIASSLTLKE